VSSYFVLLDPYLCFEESIYGIAEGSLMILLIMCVVLLLMQTVDTGVDGVVPL
jgi:hypothetical protein